MGTGRSFEDKFIYDILLTWDGLKARKYKQSGYLRGPYKKKRVDALEAPGVNFPLIEVADSGPAQAKVPEDDVVVQEADDAVRPILRAQRIAKLEAVHRIVLAFMDSDSDPDNHIDDNDESDDDYI